MNIIASGKSRPCPSRFAALLAIAVPQMVPLLGLFAALGMSTIMLLIPILIETATKWAEATRTLLAKNIVIFVVWLLILVRFLYEVEIMGTRGDGINWRPRGVSATPGDSFIIFTRTAQNLLKISAP